MAPKIIPDPEDYYFSKDTNDIKQDVARELNTLRMAVEQSFDGVNITDLKGVIIYSNPASEAIYGYEKGTIVGQHVSVLNVDPEFSVKHIIPAIKKKGNWRGDLVQKRKDGSLIYVHLSASMVFKDNTPFGMIGIVRDITDRKKIELEIQKSKKLLNETQAVTKVGGWEFDVQSGRITWTDETYRIYGVDKETYDPSDIDQDISFYAPEAQTELKQAFECALNKGRPYDLELRFIRADGKELWVRTIGNPETKNGTVMRISGNFMDITVNKRLQQENERVLDLLENVYASLEEAVFVVNAQSRVIVSCNDAAARVFGFKKNEMIGKNTEFFHVNKKKYHEFAKNLNQAIKSNGIFQCEFSMRKKDGTIFPTAHTVKELRTSSGSSTLRVSVVRDITFEKMATEKLINRKNELKKANKHLDEANTALRVLLEQREKDKKNLEEQLSINTNGLIMPYLEKIRKTSLSDLQKEYIDNIETNLREIVKPYEHRLSGELMRLSPTETRVATYVRQGYRIKEIAAKLGISHRTVEYHRDNIRGKLKIKGRKINLKTYLSNLH